MSEVWIPNDPWFSMNHNDEKNICGSELLSPISIVFVLKYSSEMNTLVQADLNNVKLETADLLGTFLIVI